MDQKNSCHWDHPVHTNYGTLHQKQLCLNVASYVRHASRQISNHTAAVFSWTRPSPSAQLWPDLGLTTDNRCRRTSGFVYLWFDPCQVGRNNLSIVVPGSVVVRLEIGGTLKLHCCKVWGSGVFMLLLVWEVECGSECLFGYNGFRLKSRVKD